MKQLILLVFLLSTSCGLFRNTTKTKTDTETTSVEKGTVKSTRAGDTITVRVPTVMYKDTTIVKRGNTTTLYQRYDSQGNLDVDCISDEIDELKEYVKNAVEKKEETVKEKESAFKPIFMLWGFLGIGFLMLVYKLLNKFL